MADNPMPGTSRGTGARASKRRATSDEVDNGPVGPKHPRISENQRTVPSVISWHTATIEEMRMLKGETEPGTVAEVLELLDGIDDPREFFNNQEREVPGIHQGNAMRQLLREFPLLDREFVIETWKRHNRQFFPAAHALKLFLAKAKDLEAKGRPDPVLQKHVLAEPRTTGFPERYPIEPTFLMEYKYWRLQTEVNEHLQQVRLERSGKKSPRAQASHPDEFDNHPNTLYGEIWTDHNQIDSPRGGSSRTPSGLLLSDLEAPEEEQNNGPGGTDEPDAHENTSSPTGTNRESGLDDFLTILAETEQLLEDLRETPPAAVSEGDSIGARRRARALQDGARGDPGPAKPYPEAWLRRNKRRRAAKKEEEEKRQALANQQGPVTRRMKTGAGSSKKTAKEFNQDILPTNGAVIWHRDHLIEKGELKVNDLKSAKANKIAEDVCKVWKNLGVPQRVFKNATDKVRAVLQKWDNHKGRGLPDADKLCDIACNCLAILKKEDISEEIDKASGRPRVPCTCDRREEWTIQAVRFYKDQRFNTLAPTIKMWYPRPRGEEELLRELENALREQPDIDRRVPPTDSNHELVEEEEALLLAQDDEQGDELDHDEPDGQGPSGTASPVHSLDGGGGEPSVRFGRDRLHQLEDELRRFESQNEENDPEWGNPSSIFPSTSTLRSGIRGPYNTKKLEALSAVASRFQFSSNAVAMLLNAHTEDNLAGEGEAIGKTDAIDPQQSPSCPHQVR